MGSEMCIRDRSVSATSVSVPWSRSGIPKARHLPCPGPTAACSRRRHRRFTNIYSFVWPWRFIVARSAARLRRTVGPLSPRHTVRNAVAGQTQQRDIIGHHQAYSGHISDIFRSYFGYEMIIACGIARCRTRRHRWSSRAVSSVAGSRAVWPVAGSRRVTSLPCSQSGIPKARRLPCPGPTAPGADAVTGSLRTFILLHVCRVQSWFSRRRG